MFAKEEKSSIEFSSAATDLIDRIMSHEESDFMEQLEAHLVGKASEIVNAAGFLSDLGQHNFLSESDQELNPEPEAQEEQWTVKAIKAACSKKAIGTLIATFQRSGNEHVLEETLEWLEALQARRKNYPIALKSLACPRVTEDRKAVRPTFFQQAVLGHGLQKVASISIIPESHAKVTFALEFHNEKLVACFDDGTAKLGNWITNEEKTIRLGMEMKGITSCQYDEKILILGTTTGTIYLFDASTLDEKWSVRLGDPVLSLKFVESTLVTLTRGVDCIKFWWVEISRSDMRLLNQMVMATRRGTENLDFFVHTNYSFLPGPTPESIQVYDTKSGKEIMNGRDKECAWSGTPICTFILCDLLLKTGMIIAGHKDGRITMWDTRELRWATNKFHGHTKAIVCLCPLNGHLLSLDQSGKLLMWSGYDLQNKNKSRPVPRVLAENFYNVKSLAAHERWFASSCSQDGIVNIWTMPEMWLRTG